MEYRFLVMGQNMKDNGNSIKLMDKENFGIPMEIFMKDTGLMIKQMVMEYITIKMGKNIQGIGKMIYKMEKELKHGLMVALMMENIKMG